MCASNVTCARLSKFRLNHSITQYFNPIWARSCHLSLLFLLSLRGSRRSSDLSSSVHSPGLPNNSSRPSPNFALAVARSSRGIPGLSLGSLLGSGACTFSC